MTAVKISYIPVNVYALHENMRIASDFLQCSIIEIVLYQSWEIPSKIP